MHVHDLSLRFSLCAWPGLLTARQPSAGLETVHVREGPGILQFATCTLAPLWALPQAHLNHSQASSSHPPLLPSARPLTLRVAAQERTSARSPSRVSLWVAAARSWHTLPSDLAGARSSGQPGLPKCTVPVLHSADEATWAVHAM